VCVELRLRPGARSERGPGLATSPRRSGGCRGPGSLGWVLGQLAPALGGQALDLGLGVERPGDSAHRLTRGATGDWSPGDGAEMLST
jgi:hypothetical protein